MAAFPSTGQIKASEFERDSDEVKEKVKNYRNSDGESVEYFEYNKGL